MFQKNKITFILFLISSPTFAGFYIGGGFGPEDANFEQKVHLMQPGTSNVNDQTNLSGWGMFGSLFAGYYWTYKKLYVAGEANINASSVNFRLINQETIHSAFAVTNYKIKQSYGISILPGYIFSAATLFYGRLGYANGKFTVTTTDTSLANVNKRLDGIRFGVGMQQIVYKNLAVRMEYSQIHYQSVSMHVINPPVIKDTHIKPQTGQVEFGLIYSFA